MQRTIARLLLILSVLGTAAPIALQALSTNPHACCLRKAAHQCHAQSTTDVAVHSPSCCTQDCCRAVRTSQFARVQPARTTTAARALTPHMNSPKHILVIATYSFSRTPRAPPLV